MKNLMIALGCMMLLLGTLGSRSIGESRTSGAKSQCCLVEGTIQSLLPSRSAVVINGSIIYISRRTAIRAGDELLQFGDLRVGMNVRATGSGSNTSMTALLLVVSSK